MARLTYNEWQRSSEQVLVSAFSGTGERITAEGYTPLQAVMEGEIAEIVEKLRHADAATREMILREFDEEEREWLLADLGSDDEEIAAAAAREIVMEIRVEVLRTLVRYVWQSSRNPWSALKNFLAVVRGVMPREFGGMGVRQMAVVLNESPAATSAREIKFEQLAEQWGIVSVRVSGAKTKEAREGYKAAQMGNRNRKGGKRVA